jgi:hypothetical protein
VASVLDAGARPFTVEAGAALDHPAVLRRRSACARAAALCEDLGEELDQLAAVVAPPRQPSPPPQLKGLLADLLADAGELLFRAASLAGTVPALTAAEPACEARDVAGATVDLERLLARIDEQLRDAALGDLGAAARALPLAARFLAGIAALRTDGSPDARPRRLAQHRSRHRLTALPVDGGVDLVLAVPAAAEPPADRPSSPHGCSAATPIGAR